MSVGGRRWLRRRRQTASDGDASADAENEFPERGGKGIFRSRGGVCLLLFRWIFEVDGKARADFANITICRRNNYTGNFHEIKR